MSEYYEGSTQEATDEGIKGLEKLEAALDRAVTKYFDRHQGQKGTEVTFRVVELYVIGSNPIHGYRVVLKPEK